MADIMSSHCPAPPSSAGPVDLISLPPRSSLARTGYHHISAGYSGDSTPYAMSQSLVTPQGHADSSAIGLAAEKRRNKLGYHRTSVACGHCRRRKIRCIPSPGDVQSRCINCIRLKKDCSFFPVDQQPQPDTRKKPQSSATVPLKPEPFSPDKISARNSFDYTHGGIPTWTSADTSPNPSKPADMPWSPYTTHTASATATWSSQLDSAGARTADDPWSYPPQPPRSLSFGSDTVSNGGHSTSQPPYPSISQITRGTHHSSGGGSVSGSGAAALSEHLYQSPVSTAGASPGIDSIGAALDGHAALSGGSAYPNWSHTYSYSKDAAEAYVNWGDHGAPAGEAHAASSMYYTR